MNTRFIILSGLALATTSLASPPAGRAAELYASGPCTPTEKWRYAAGVPQEARVSFEKLILGQVSPMQGFAEGGTLSRESPLPPVRLFGEYWRDRALLQGEMASAALDGFATIVAEPATPETVGVQIAAIGCLNRIHEAYPALPLPREIASRLPRLYSLAPREISRQPLRELTLSLIISELAENPASRPATALAGLLAGAGAYESFARGFVAAAQGDHPHAIGWLEKIVGRSRAEDHLPAELGRQLVHARLVLARSYYSARQFDRAAQQYNLIERSSNETPEMLSELAWSYLLQERYADAVGTATNLQLGRMKGTFTPEAPVVMAMALNELCQYPDSLRAVQLFHRDYDAAYQWLQGWSRNPAKPLYPIALSFLQNRAQSPVPERIAGEWVRSNTFISRQQEIHRLYGEKHATQAFLKGGEQARAGLAREIRQVAGDLNVGIREESDGQLRIYSSERISPARAPDFATLKRNVAVFNRLREAADQIEEWQASQESRSAAIRARLVAEINADLARRSRRMLRQLEEVGENSRLVEIEIYNGASHDMIWRNAHPDYAEIEKKVKVAYSRPKGHTLNWGTVNPTNDKVEVWEDELGSFKANLHDNCASKEKYLALKGQSG